MAIEAPPNTSVQAAGTQGGGLCGKSEGSRGTQVLPPSVAFDSGLTRRFVVAITWYAGRSCRLRFWADIGQRSKRNRGVEGIRNRAGEDHLNR